jgi:8-oxo-dGTP pyrophosphatase MutT (NUDIX family)
MTANAPFIPAASALVVRDHAEHGIEVLLVKRGSASRSFANMWAFPGGKVDPADFELAQLLGNELPQAARPGLTPDLLAFGIASWRELLEETGGDQALCHDPARLATMLASTIYWSHWVAPREAPVAFDTRFFLLDARILPHEPRPDGHEISELRWLTPTQAVADFHAEHLAAAPPTAFNLMELQLAATGAGSARNLLAREQGRPNYTAMPWDAHFAELDGEPVTGEPVPVPERYRALPSRVPVRPGTFARKK